MDKKVIDEHNEKISKLISIGITGLLIYKLLGKGRVVTKTQTITNYIIVNERGIPLYFISGVGR